jgi:hypothetical protein
MPLLVFSGAIIRTDKQVPSIAKKVFLTKEIVMFSFLLDPIDDILIVHNGAKFKNILMGAWFIFNLRKITSANLTCEHGTFIITIIIKHR